MKNLYSHILFAFIFTFLGTQFSFAQDSKEILELKSKLSKAKTTDEKIRSLSGVFYEYLRNGIDDSASVYAKRSQYYFDKTNNHTAYALFDSYIGKLYLNKRDFASAEKYLIKASNEIDKSDNLKVKSVHDMNLAAFYTFKKENKKAVDLYEKNLQYYKEKKISKEYAVQAYAGLFANAISNNSYAAAFKYINTYLDFMKKNFPEYISSAYFQIGNVYMESKNFRKAIENFKKAIALSSNEQNFYTEYSKIYLALSYNEIKQIDSARYYLKSPLDYFTRLDDKSNLSSVFYVKSQIEKNEGLLSEAENSIRKAIDLSPEMNLFASKLRYEVNLSSILLKKVEATTFQTEEQKRNALKEIVRQQKNNINKMDSLKLLSNELALIVAYDDLSRANELLGDYDKAFYYLKKSTDQNNNLYDTEKLYEFSDVQSEIEIANARAKLKLEEETKRIQLQKELELKALRYEFDKKQAAAKTEEERQRLLLEEEHKRREISIKYDEEQKAVALKYAQEKKVAKAEQEKKDAEAKAELSKSKNIRNMSIGGAVTALLLLGFAGWSYNQKRKDGIKIAAEKKKSEDLLLNILPQEVAQELKEKGKSDAKYYDEVSVLFTDFVNFTATSEKIGVQELLEELNVCFTEFDNIMGRHGLEKIKTIGDAYLAVSGLPTVNKDHAKNAIAASQEILKFIEERKKVSPNALDLRIGIHSGHVIAGIVGVKKFAYDIWGDTVNTAARMEQAGEKGKINISKNTYELVKDDFATTYRGKISVKGKGEQEMYFVEKA